jgi:hypothetical protein
VVNSSAQGRSFTIVKLVPLTMQCSSVWIASKILMVFMTDTILKL